MMGIFVNTTGSIFRPGGCQKNTQWDWSVSLSERIVECVHVSQTNASPTLPPIMQQQRLGRFLSVFLIRDQDPGGGGEMAACALGFLAQE
jgi:hypothetical protein